MNKNLIALAVAAGLAMPGIAAADMKIIGQAQLELVNTSTGGAGNPVNEGLTMDDGSEAGNVGSGNASALGVTGSHDIGNGLTGLYKINFNFHADDNSGGFDDRDQFLGMKGDFGTVLVGRMNTPYKSSTVKWDPLLATFMQARGSNGMSSLHNGYIDNTIAYANNFGTAKFVGAIGIDESDSDGNNEADGDHTISVSLNLPVAEALELAVAYQDIASVNDGTALKVGLKWTSGDITVAGQLESLDAGVGDTTNLYANVNMALGNGAAIVAGVATQSDESTGGNNDGTYTTLAYKKALSKKVSTHVGIVMVDEGAIGLNNDATQIGAGVRVKF